VPRVESLARFGAELVLTSYLHAEAAEHLGACCDIRIAGRYERTATR